VTEVSFSQKLIDRDPSQNEDGFLLVETLISLSIAAFVIAATYVVLSPLHTNLLLQQAPQLYHQTEVYQSEFSSIGSPPSSEKSDLDVELRFNFLVFTAKIGQPEGNISAISIVGSD